MTARVSVLLKSCASLTCFRACFLPGRAKDLQQPGTCDKLWATEPSVKGRKRSHMVELFWEVTLRQWVIDAWPLEII